MTKTTGLIDVETGERGWLQYDTSAPVKFLMWFKSKYVENSVRKYLSEPFEMAVQVRKPRAKPVILDDGIEYQMVKPTDSLPAFETALSQMEANIQVALEPIEEG